jgi:uncharacterized Zn ribbon protein
MATCGRQQLGHGHQDLKVRASSVVKVGTKVRNIRLVEGDHSIV